MQNAMDRLNQINAYYFDRCNYFYEFEAVSKDDIRMLGTELMNIPCPESLVNYIHFNAAGNLRKAIKIMHMLEVRSKINPIPAMNHI